MELFSAPIFFGVSILYPFHSSCRLLQVILGDPYAGSMAPASSTTVGGASFYLQQQKVQWLSYWIFATFFLLFDAYLGGFLVMVPGYTLARLGFVLWLQLPQFNGAAKLLHVLRPYLTHINVFPTTSAIGLTPGSDLHQKVH